MTSYGKRATTRQGCGPAAAGRAPRAAGRDRASDSACGVLALLCFGLAWAGGPDSLAQSTAGAGLPLPGATSYAPPPIAAPPTPPAVVDQAARWRAGDRPAAAAAPSVEVPANLPLPGRTYYAPPERIARPPITGPQRLRRPGGVAASAMAPVTPPIAALPSTASPATPPPAAMPGPGAPVAAVPAATPSPTVPPIAGLPPPSNAEVAAAPHPLNLPAGIAANRVPPGTVASTPVPNPGEGPQTLAASNQTAPAGDERLPMLPTMIPPPLRTELPGMAQGGGKPPAPMLESEPVMRSALAPSQLGAPGASEPSPRGERERLKRDAEREATTKRRRPAPAAPKPAETAAAPAPAAEPAPYQAPLQTAPMADLPPELSAATIPPPPPDVALPAEHRGAVPVIPPPADAPPPPVLPLPNPGPAAEMSPPDAAPSAPDLPPAATSAPAETVPPDLSGGVGALQTDDLPPPPPELPLPSAAGLGAGTGSTPAQPAAPPPPAAAARDDAVRRSIGDERPGRMAALEPQKRGKSAPIGASTRGAARLEVSFAYGSADLDAAARATIRQVADAVRQNGRRIRIVGHASNQAADRTADDHMLANFEMSLKRATAVSDELMRLGVDPGAIVVEAVGDRQARDAAGPVSEARSHSADIYLE